MAIAAVKSFLKDSIVTIGTICLIWIGLLFVQFGIIGSSFTYGPGDMQLAYFSFGLNWLSFDPWLRIHGPGPTFNYLSGLLVSTLNIDFTDAPLKSFMRMGIAIQGMTTLVSAIWFAWASKILQLNYVTRVILLLTIFSFPPVLIFSGNWGYGYTVAILGAPLGLTLLAAIRGHNKACVLGGVGCGFLAANYYPSIFVILAFLVAMGLQTYNKIGRPPLSGPWIQELKQQRTLIVLFGISSIGAQIIWAIRFVGNKQWPLVEDLLWITYKTAPIVAFFIVSSAIILILIRWDRRFQVFILWTIVAFILGSFVLLPWYYPNLLRVGAIDVDIFNIFHDLIFLLDDLPWLAVFWLFVVLLTYVAIRNRRMHQLRLAELSTLPYDLLFITITIIPIAITASFYMQPEGSPSYAVPGIAERIFVAATPAITAGWVLILLGTPTNRRIYLFFTIVIFCLVVNINWYRNYNNVIEKNRVTGTIIDNTVENFFERYPTGQLLGVRDAYFSRYCSTAYAYNRWRTIDSAMYLPSHHLFDNKVIYIWPTDDRYGTIENILGGIDSTYFVIAGTYVNRLQRFFLRQGAQVVHVSEFPVQAFIATTDD